MTGHALTERRPAGPGENPRAMEREDAFITKNQRRACFRLAAFERTGQARAELEAAEPALIVVGIDLAHARRRPRGLPQKTSSVQSRPGNSLSFKSSVLFYLDLSSVRAKPSSVTDDRGLP